MCRRSTRTICPDTVQKCWYPDPSRRHSTAAVRWERVVRQEHCRDRCLPLSRDKTLRYINAVDLQFRMASRLHVHARTRRAQNFLLKFVAVALDGEDDVVAVECSVVNRGDAVAVG